jgi:hypothetical protein
MKKSMWLPREKKSKLDGLSWPPVLPELIAGESLELLAQFQAIERNRTSRRGARVASRDRARLKPKAIKLVAARMLVTCGSRRQVPPAALVELISAILTGVSVSELQDALDTAMGWHRLVSPEMLAAVNYEWHHKDAPLRAVAAAAGVDHKTVAKWRRDPRYKMHLPSNSWWELRRQSGE